MKKILVLFMAAMMCIAMAFAANAEEAPKEEAILFPECPMEFVKAKEYYGYYILMDTDVIFALNEDETRFCVKFNGIGGNMVNVFQGDVHEDGTVKVDDTYNGLFGEDVQTMYEDALEEKADWAPIDRGSTDIDIENLKGDVEFSYYYGGEVKQTKKENNTLVQVPSGMVLGKVTVLTDSGNVTVNGVAAKEYNVETQSGNMDFFFPEDTGWHVQLETISDIFESDFEYDVTMQRHEYLYGDAAMDLNLMTIIGQVHVMKKIS